MIRATQARKLGWIFEKDETETTCKRFNYKDRNAEENTNYFRIPDHQRFPNWSKEKKKCLVDSILRNYPIHSIICSKHFEIGPNGRIKEYMDIEDGQTRLSILQSYYNGDFKNSHGNSFEDLSSGEQRSFENYEVNIEIIEVDDDNEIHEIFDRLQMGQPLRDCDKFWNWIDEPLIKYAIELIKSEKLNKYMGTNKFSSEKRERISDIVGLLSLIIYWDIVNCDYVNNTFKSHFKHIKKEISDSDKEKVNKFIEYYFSIIDRSYVILPKKKNEKTKKYYNICSDLGLILYDYFENNHIDIEDREAMWVEYFVMSRKNKDLTTGKKLLWNNVEGKPNWTQPKYVACRVRRVHEFYDSIYSNNLEEFCEQNNIVIDQDQSDSESEND